jgi:hypothetical protein
MVGCVEMTWCVLQLVILSRLALATGVSKDLSDRPLDMRITVGREVLRHAAIPSRRLRMTLSVWGKIFNFIER